MSVEHGFPVHTPAGQRELLQGVDFFRDLDDAAIEAIRQRCKVPDRREAARLLIRQGKPVPGLLMIAEGEVKLTIRAIPQVEDWPASDFEVRRAGQYFGEIECCRLNSEEGLALASAEIISGKAQFLYLPREDFRELMRTLHSPEKQNSADAAMSPTPWETTMDMLARTLDRRAFYLRTAHLTARQRLCAFLFHEALTKDLDLTNDELAPIVGVSDGNKVSRMLTELADVRAIARIPKPKGRGRLTRITDVETLTYMLRTWAIRTNRD